MAELFDELELKSARQSTRTSTRFDVAELVRRGKRRSHRSEDERADMLTEAMAPWPAACLVGTENDAAVTLRDELSGQAVAGGSRREEGQGRKVTQPYFTALLLPCMFYKLHSENGISDGVCVLCTEF